MRTCKSILVACLFAAAAALVPAIGLCQPGTAWVKFCGDWQSRYSDSGIGEDSFTSSSDTYRDAQYAYAGIFEVLPGDDELVWGNAPLDEVGCTPSWPLSVGVQYRFRMRSLAQYDSGRRIFVEPYEATTWTDGNDGFEIFDFFFRPLIEMSYTVYANAAKTYETNLMPIAGKVWDKQEDGLLGIPSDSVVLIRHDNESESPGYWYNGRYWDDTPDPGGYRYRVWSASTSSFAKKFVLSHEIGHAVGHAKAHLRRGAISYGLAQPYADCSCYHIDTETDPDDTDYVQHCLQSRENIRVAESEGWAHFFSSTVFNTRTSANGHFGYYKDIVGPDYTDCVDEPVCDIDLTDDKTWMENNCATSMTNKGVEWDWLTFFWGLWTEDPDYKYTMTQITDVWDEVLDVDTEADTDLREWHWTDLSLAADNLYTYYKWREFVDQGDYSGVDH